jgi:hypothetical protein
MQPDQMVHRFVEETGTGNGGHPTSLAIQRQNSLSSVTPNAEQSTIT